MRAHARVPWATCALAMFIASPALAQPRARSVASCAAFDQSNKDENKVAFAIHNACTIPLDCSVSWRLVCAPESKARRASHPGRATFSLAAGARDAAEASAATCGDDGWTLDSVQWSCQPSKD